MLYLHPILQALTTLLSLAVLYLGAQRFAMSHLGAKARFRWKEHVRLGTAVCVLWTAGLVGGMYMTKTYWNKVGVTGEHFQNALALFPFIVLSYGTGWFMDKYKKKRKLLPLAHALTNILLLALVLRQVWTGWEVLERFLWSY